MPFTEFDTFQSTHPMRGATTQTNSMRAGRRISIHAPHAGCDGLCRQHAGKHPISIHAPHAGCDQCKVFFFHQVLNISIHAPHAGCDYKGKPKLDFMDISIHAPHAGCDGSVDILASGTYDFNPRTPCGVRRARAASIDGG